MASATERPAPTDRLRASIAWPVFASFVWPGIGHWMLGARRTAVVLALPQLGLVVAVVIGLAAGMATLLGWLVDPLVLIGLIGLNLVLLLTRAYGVAGSAVRASSGRPGRATVALVLALVVGSIGIHGEAARVGWAAYETLTTVFSPTGPQGGAFGDPTASTPPPTATPWPSFASGMPEAQADPTPVLLPPPDYTADGRLNLLLIGADAGPGRWKLRTDTMILLSVEVSTGKAALIGIPRNIRFAPMPPPLDATFPGGFTDLLNALWVYVDTHPDSYPGDPGLAPFQAVQDSIGLLTGVQVDGMVVAELNGFVRAVDALGGLDITIPAPVHDSHYPNPDGSGEVDFSLPAGAQHLDGWNALAYARTRHQDSDYQRMARQQTVLVALQRQLRCSAAFRITELLGIARDSLWTNLSVRALPTLVQVASQVDPDRIARLTLTPPAFYPNLDAAGVEHIRAAVADLLATPAPTPAPSASPAPGSGC